MNEPTMAIPATQREFDVAKYAAYRAMLSYVSYQQALRLLEVHYPDSERPPQ